MKIPQPLLTSLFALWAGFVAAISFMEAWLKFRAEGVTREIGLGIGKLVFSALNRVEIALFFLTWIILLLHKAFKPFRLSIKNGLFWLVGVILLVQSFWLIPTLMHRADVIISGSQPPDSPVHLLFGIVEFIKVVCLLILSLTYKQTNPRSWKG